MKPIRTPDTNDVMVGTEGSGISPLPVLVEDGKTYSTWELSEQERAKIAAGALVELVVFSYPQPPVALVVEPPRAEDGTLMQWEPRLGIFVNSVPEITCAKCGECVGTGEKVWVVGARGPEDPDATFYHPRCKPA